MGTQSENTITVPAVFDRGPLLEGWRSIVVLVGFLSVEMAMIVVALS